MQVVLANPPKVPGAAKTPGAAEAPGAEAPTGKNGTAQSVGRCAAGLLLVAASAVYLLL